jgi:hypothetical protein
MRMLWYQTEEKRADVEAIGASLTVTNLSRLHGNRVSVPKDTSHQKVDLDLLREEFKRLEDAQSLFKPQNWTFRKGLSNSLKAKKKIDWEPIWLVEANDAINLYLYNYWPSLAQADKGTYDKMVTAQKEAGEYPDPWITLKKAIWMDATTKVLMDSVAKLHQDC